MLPPGGRTRTSSLRLLKSLPRVRSTSCHWRSVHCYGAPRYSAMSSPRTCSCRCSGTLRPRGREPNYSPGCQASLCRPVTSYAFVTRFFGKSRTLACPINDAANYMRRPLRFWKTTTAAADRRPEILALHYFVARNYEKAMDYGWRAGERAMARYAPAAAADAYRRAAQAARLSSGVSPSERSFYLEALGDAEFLAGRPTEAAAAYLEALRGVRGQPLREAHLALKLTRVEQRRGHYSNALRRASLGLRAVSGATGPEAGAARAGLQARYAWLRVQQGRYADARRWA